VPQVLVRQLSGEGAEQVHTLKIAFLLKSGPVFVDEEFFAGGAAMHGEAEDAADIVGASSRALGLAQDDVVAGERAGGDLGLQARQVGACLGQAGFEDLPLLQLAARGTAASAR
jgi:hypothetical protein